MICCNESVLVFGGLYVVHSVQESIMVIRVQYKSDDVVVTCDMHPIECLNFNSIDK